MQEEIRDSIEAQLGISIQKVIRISGGDISQAWLLETPSEKIFCKHHMGKLAHPMLLAESRGLQALAKTRTLRIPGFLSCIQVPGGACLLLEFIPTKRAEPSDMERLGQQLAALHKEIGPGFGWQEDNFIGSLPQRNTLLPNWPEFYLQNRLLPQLKRAGALGLLQPRELPAESEMSYVLRESCPDVSPALLHGDLWAGNFLIADDGSPCLIDPAVYYGDPEADLAMTRLFGGFSTEFYKAYRVHFPEPLDCERLHQLYQLYYLLVHLNLFGRSYYPNVKSLLCSCFPGPSKGRG